MLVTVLLSLATIAIGTGSAIDYVNVRMRMNVTDQGRQQIERRAMIVSLLFSRIGLIGNSDFQLERAFIPLLQDRPAINQLSLGK